MNQTIQSTRTKPFIKLMPMTRSLRGRAGTSLIEVLITLVVFLTGMVYIVRMFPGGFVSLRHDENVTAANRLAQSELERLQGRAINLPSGILPWGWDGSKYNVLPLTDPTSMDDQVTAGMTMPPDFNMYYHTDVNKFRRVVGEYTRIPSPISVDQDFCSVYVLQFSPIVVDMDNTLLVAGGALRRRWINSNQAVATRLRSFGDYAIDYEEAKIYLRPSTAPRDRLFIINYSYWVDSGSNKMTLVPVLGVPVRVPSATSAQVNQGFVVVDIPAPSGGLIAAEPGFDSIDRASDTLSRQFRQVASWSSDNDPYEYKLLDPYLGVLAFSHLSYGYEEYTARGRQPLVANITYTVMDWHIIREERRLPNVLNSAADHDARMTLRFIMESGQSEETGGIIYGGLARRYALPHDVIAADIETGRWYTNDPSSDNYLVRDAAGNPIPGRPSMSVDYRGGVVRFDPAFVAIHEANPNVTSPFAGKTFRIFYRAEGDWAVQTYKAYESFQRSYGNGVNGLDQRQYYLMQDRAPSGGNAYYRLGVLPCNAGTTITVDFAYTVGGSTQEQFASGQVYQVSEQPEANGLCYVDLSSNLTSTWGSGTDINVTRVTKVSGVSLGVRVVWRESGRGFSAGRWRKVNLETYLTRPDN